MPSDVTPRQVFLDSLERCVRAEGFADKFYERFLASSEDVRLKFRNTNFDRQKAMIVRSLELCAKAIDGDREGLSELKARSETHDRYHLNIKAPLYDLWLESLLQAAAETDPEWSQAVEEVWRTTLHHVINRMVSAY